MEKSNMIEYNKFWNDYQNLTTLGSSLFGTVYKARRIKDNAIVSIKEYSKYQEGAIETYEDLVEMTEGVDPASNSKLKEILADEQEHLQELKDFLNDMQ